MGHGDGNSEIRVASLLAWRDDTTSNDDEGPTRLGIVVTIMICTSNVTLNKELEQRHLGGHDTSMIYPH